MDLGKANEIAQLLANVATFLGIPIAVIAYLRDRRKDKAEREVETFTTLNDVYVDYLKLCFDHPQGSWYSHGEMDERRLSPDEIRDYVLFEIMICSCESAYYLYRDQSTAFKRRQWEGWNKYIRDWCDTDWFQGH
jgi:hypothetical protein